MRRLLLPVILVILFVSESVFVELFSGQAFGMEQIIVPHFLFSAIVFLAIFVDEKYGLFYGIIFGLLYDVVYTEILGVHLFLFPVIAYLIAKLLRFLQNHLVVAVIITIIGVALLEIIVFQINYLIGFTEFTFNYYITYRLAPTIILNVAFLIIFSYPLKKYYEKFALRLENE